MQMQSITVTETYDIIGTLSDGSTVKLGGINGTTLVMEPSYMDYEDEVLAYFGPMLGPFLVDNVV